MGTDETVLTSFVADDERLVDTWRVGTVGRGFHRPPIGPTDGEPVAVTDRRLLWYDDELDEVAREDVVDLTRDAVERTSAPRVVRVGGGLLTVGLVTTVGAYLLSVLDFPAVLAPAGAGLAAFLATLVSARATGKSGTHQRFPYLQVDAGDDLVTVWGDEEDLAAIAAALGERSVEAE